jgi:hypothetical protein
MQFYRISKGKFVPCNQNQAQFVRNSAGEMVGLNAAGLPRMSRPLMDDTPKGRVHVFDVTDRAPFSASIATGANPERATKIDAVRERRESTQRVKMGGGLSSITKGATKATKAVVQEEQNATIAATIAEFFALLEKTEMQVNSGLFNAANEGIAELRDLANSVPTKQREPLRKALRLLVTFKNEAVKSDREKRRETARHERTAKSAERAATIRTRRDGIAAAKANKAANTVGRGPAPFYTAKTGQAVARQLAERRNLERARF